MTLGPGGSAQPPDAEAAVQAALSLLQQYTRHSFAPLVKGFAAEAAKVSITIYQPSIPTSHTLNVTSGGWDMTTGLTWSIQRVT